MEIVAHGLWAAAGAITLSRTTIARSRTKWAVWWGVFPEVVAFGPSIIAGVVLLANLFGGCIPLHIACSSSCWHSWRLPSLRAEWCGRFWGATYAALAIVYLALWRKGWLNRPVAEDRSMERV